MEGSGMHIHIDENLIEPVIKAEIQTAIVRQLQLDENLIPKLVAAALADKVNDTGRKDLRYTSNNKYLFIDVLCRNAIQDAARAAMKEYIEDSHDALKRQIKKALREQESKIAKIFVESLAEGVQAKWSFKVSIPMPGKE
ncbi:MAG: hypothetical protein ACYSW3_02185 [Planctomycetota bacterium]|jgi:hypothetical protein